MLCITAGVKMLFAGIFNFKFYIVLFECMHLDQVPLLYLFQETSEFVYNQEASKESIRHEKIQSNMELVLLCISIAAVILALILLTALR